MEATITEFKPIKTVQREALTLGPCVNGTEKQIKWANEVRERKIASALDLLNRTIKDRNNHCSLRLPDLGVVEKMRGELLAYKQGYMQGMIEMLKNREASYWIDAASSTTKGDITIPAVIAAMENERSLREAI